MNNKTFTIQLVGPQKGYKLKKGKKENWAVFITEDEKEPKGFSTDKKGAEDYIKKLKQFLYGK